MTAIQSPCLGCERRHAYCHGNCNEYYEYRRQLDRHNERVRAETILEHRLNDHATDAIAKAKKRKRRII